MGETQAPFIRGVANALGAHQLAQVTAEAHAALRRSADGQQVTIPAQVISGVGGREARP